jgi:hypothetical protein
MPSVGVLAESFYEWVPLGDPAVVRTQEAQAVVAAELPISEETAPSLDVLAERLKGKISRTLLQTVLKDFHTQGVAEVIGKGRRGDPYRYFRSDRPEKSFPPELPLYSGWNK